MSIKRPRAKHFARGRFIFITLLAGNSVLANGSEFPPGLSETGRSAYDEYLSAASHKAFAVAPGGSWAWQAEESTPDLAQQRALEACRAATPQKCVLYAIDQSIVFDAKAWSHLWGPYGDKNRAAAAASGILPGQRFPDIAWHDDAGRIGTLGKLNGKVVVVHFWASWCPPCRRELPELEKLYKALSPHSGITFVFLQVREPISISQQWLAGQGLRIPLANSGSKGREDTDMHLANGQAIADREVARAFPSSYVIDKHGLVVFSHTGPVTDWLAYAAFLRDAATHSGK